MPPPRPRPPRRPRADRVGLALAWAAVVVVGLGALGSLAPAGVGLSMTTPWAQLGTLRAGVGAAALVLALLLAVVAVGVRVHLRGRPRRWPVPLLALAGCLVVTGVGQGAVLLARTAPPARGDAALPGRQPGDLVVTTFNVGPSGTPPQEVVDLVVRRGSDVLALTEAPEALAQDVADGLARAGRSVQLFSPAPGDPPPLRGGLGSGGGLLLPFVEANTRLLVAQDLGRYVAVDGAGGAGVGAPAPPSLLGGAVVAVPVDGDGPPLAAVHTLPALPLLFDMDRWRSETAAAVGLCDDLPGGVVAGDLNVTQDHSVLRAATCTDAATSRSAHAAGTWPSDLPAPLAAPVDHVLADADAWEAVASAVDDVAGSDHRALTALLSPRTSSPLPPAGPSPARRRGPSSPNTLLEVVPSPSPGSAAGHEGRRRPRPSRGSA